MIDQNDKGAAYSFLPSFERGPRGETTAKVERVLRAAIVGLDFQPGEFIDKALVCARLGVSRFPVSEALGRLAAEGLGAHCPETLGRRRAAAKGGSGVSSPARTHRHRGFRVDPPKLTLSQTAQCQCLQQIRSEVE